ncbi:MAG: hypothetical protein C5B51_14290 [Terriglobia bacterium]|nr:MAG: hypothetical protein C5B51_14290 [Terriglobia bacterium]
MQVWKGYWGAAALVVVLTRAATAQVAILQIQIVEGEGGVHAPGARLVRPLAVVVTDETGRPVAGAAVSFHLPDDGPGGTFLNGLRTDVSTTDERGRASLRSMQLNRMPGRFQIRVIASKEQARAGTMSFQYIAEAGSGAAKPQGVAVRSASHSRGKWIAAAVAMAGGGAAAGVFALRPKNTAAPAAAPALTLTIGAPSITVGKP